MRTIDELIEDALLLIEQNFYFLHTGEFFARMSKVEDLSEKAEDIVIYNDDVNSYKVNSRIVKMVLKDAYKNENIGMFEYFVEFSAIRSICMAMVEAIRLEGDFRDFMQEILHGDRFDDFYDILSFVRNVLSHNIHSEIRLSFKDFDGTKRRIFRMRRDPNIFFTFIYSADLPNFETINNSYGFSVNVNFEKINEESLFSDIFSMWDLFMICELCFNLVQIFREKRFAVLKRK